ncbi:autotransporter assembly complex protein TamA [Vibrio mexicanus]|uniref:autotransporter assembly complex protein TamA n=1 Tax=Vibrio mexicanus TaxID=1004326 RepID=UPI00069A4766|nr:BamA/TamA family outer membrane protein [Vibrio mexicanus]
MRWRQPWYNKKGHSFQTELNLSAPEQALSLGYRIPTIDASNDYYAINFDLAKVDYLDTDSFSSTLSFEKTWRFDLNWEGRLFLSYLHERYVQASEENETQLTLPGFEAIYLSDSAQDASISHGHRLSLEYSDPNLLSDTRLLRLTGDTHFKWAISSKQNIQISGRWGANMASDIHRVPSSLRFFAGGTNSLRGYKFDSISPTDSNGELTGGLNLATVAVDYQRQLFSSLWGGVFFDMGDSFNDKPDWKRGTGLSLEWQTKYLPIKLDVAKGLDSEEDELRLHLSFGVQF